MGSQTFSFGTWHLAVADLTTRLTLLAPHKRAFLAEMSSKARSQVTTCMQPKNSTSLYHLLPIGIGVLLVHVVRASLLASSYLAEIMFT